MDRSGPTKRRESRPGASRTTSSPPAPATPASQTSRPLEERAEPKSDYLRKLLAEKREKAARQGERPETPKPKARDDWIFESDDEDSARRSRRTRRGSERLSASRSPSAPHHFPITSREHQERLDRLQKENFDIKLRFQLQEEYVEKLEKKLDEALHEGKTKKDLERDIKDLVNENEVLAEQANKLEKEVEQVKGINAEVTALNDDLFEELTKRDSDLGEATDMVLKLETEVENLKAALAEAQNNITPRQSSEFSGYYSSSPPLGSPERTTINTPAQAELDNLPNPSASIPRRDIFSPLIYDPRQPRPLTTRMATIVQNNTLSTKQLTTRASFCSLNHDMDTDSEGPSTIAETLERTRISHPVDQHWQSQIAAPSYAPRNSKPQQLAPAPALARDRASPALTSVSASSLPSHASPPETPTPAASHFSNQNNTNTRHNNHPNHPSNNNHRNNTPTNPPSSPSESSTQYTPVPIPHPHHHRRPRDDWDIFSNRDDDGSTVVPPSIDENDSIYDVPTLHTAGFARRVRGGDVLGGGSGGGGGTQMRDVGRNFFFNGF